jgi:hypothetical protein
MLRTIGIAAEPDAVAPPCLRHRWSLFLPPPLRRLLGQFCATAGHPMRAGSHDQCSSDRGFFWRWSSYRNFALDKATVSACPIQIDYVRLPLGYRA